MNRIKKDLHNELQSLSLSSEKRQYIVKKSTGNWSKKKRESNWSYRFVLTAFTILGLSFGFLLWKQEGTNNLEITTTAKEAIAIEKLFSYDFSKTILLIGIFVFIRILIKNRINKKAHRLPICLNCGEEWSFRNALKNSMKSREVKCPQCGYEQYRTKKSLNKTSLLNFILPFGIIVAQLFNHVMLGFSVFTACALAFVISLSPYMIELQEEDPMKEFLIK